MTGFSRLLTVIALVAFLASCGEKKSTPSYEITEPPDSLISEENMAHILADVHTIEAALVLERNEGTTDKDKTARLYRGLFAKYHLTRNRYDASLRFYQQNPYLMKKIYEKVVPELENREKLIQNRDKK